MFFQEHFYSSKQGHFPFKHMNNNPDCHQEHLCAQWEQTLYGLKVYILVPPLYLPNHIFNQLKKKKQTPQCNEK